MKQNLFRDISIDIVKFLAVFLIINSHIDICYAKYAFLATGGAIGDGLFLFCSGYTLFWKKQPEFSLYYKRRINRIYPSVFACMFFVYSIGLVPVANINLKIYFGGEFIIAIMIYYILLYIIQKYAMNKMKYIFLGVVLITITAYYFFPHKYDVGEKGIYGISTLFRWIPYFGLMLMGAAIGKKQLSNTKKKNYLKFTPVLLIISIFLFYGIQLLAKVHQSIAPMQIISLPFLYTTVYFIWMCCNSSIAEKIYNNKFGNIIIMSIGGLCLESYLIQQSLITNKFNFIFPLNIPLVVLIILLAAYLCRCFARLFSQTFGSVAYDWKQIFSIK